MKVRSQWALISKLLACIQLSERKWRNTHKRRSIGWLEQLLNNASVVLEFLPPGEGQETRSRRHEHHSVPSLPALPFSNFVVGCATRRISNQLSMHD